MSRGSASTVARRQIEPGQLASLLGIGDQIQGLVELVNNVEYPLLVARQEHPTNHEMAPPTLNLDSPIEEAEGLNLVPHKAQEASVSAVMNNSFGFGGTNATVIFKKAD